jgi:tRNA modification GTPase
MTALPDLSATICALATPPGEGALGVIRVSGPRALEVVQSLTPKLLLCLGG